MSGITEMISKAWDLRVTRLAEQKKLDAMEAEEKALMMQIQDQMVLAGEEYVQAMGLVQAKCVETIDPEVTNWSVFQEHIRTTGQLDLLPKRPMMSAIKARWETGDDVPGVERVAGHRTTLSLVK